MSPAPAPADDTPGWRSSAASQEGVLARGQGLRPGLTEDAWQWRLDLGRWRTVLPGVAVTHSGPVEERQRCWAALLYAGEGAVLSGLGALRLDGLDPRRSGPRRPRAPATTGATSAVAGVAAHAAGRRRPGARPPAPCARPRGAAAPLRGPAAAASRGGRAPRRCLGPERPRCGDVRRCRRSAGPRPRRGGPGRARPAASAAPAGAGRPSPRRDRVGGAGPRRARPAPPARPLRTATAGRPATAGRAWRTTSTPGGSASASWSRSTAAPPLVAQWEADLLRNDVVSPVRRRGPALHGGQLRHDRLVVGQWAAVLRP